MAWWAWAILFVVLILVIAAVLGLMALGLWRQFTDVRREVRVATERFALISEQLERLQEAQQKLAKPEPAVLGDVGELRRQRDKAIRQARAVTELRIRVRKDRAERRAAEFGQR